MHFGLLGWFKSASNGKPSPFGFDGKPSFENPTRDVPNKADSYVGFLQWTAEMTLILTII